MNMDGRNKRLETGSHPLKVIVVLLIVFLPFLIVHWFDVFGFLYHSSEPSYGSTEYFESIMSKDPDTWTTTEKKYIDNFMEWADEN